MGGKFLVNFRFLGLQKRCKLQKKSILKTFKFLRDASRPSDVLSLMAQETNACLKQTFQRLAKANSNPTEWESTEFSVGFDEQCLLSTLGPAEAERSCATSRALLGAWWRNLPGGGQQHGVRGR